jgi:hypothetical protein
MPPEQELLAFGPVVGATSLIQRRADAVQPKRYYERCYPGFRSRGAARKGEVRRLTGSICSPDA